MMIVMIVIMVIVVVIVIDLPIRRDKADTLREYITRGNYCRHFMSCFGCSSRKKNSAGGAVPREGLTSTPRTTIRHLRQICLRD